MPPTCTSRLAARRSLGAWSRNLVSSVLAASLCPDHEVLVAQQEPCAGSEGFAATNFSRARSCSV